MPYKLSPTAGSPSPPFTPVEDHSCFKSSSSSPEIRLCSLETTCFTTIRTISNGSKTYRRGCSRRNKPCVPENRNRKMKICCNESLCNRYVPGFIPPPRKATESTEGTTDPVTPDISITNPAPLPTCTSETTTSDTPTSTDITTHPQTRPPVTASPPNPADNLCYCDQCQNHLCSSPLGCVTIFNTAGTVVQTTRGCIVDTDICSYSHGAQVTVQCCYEFMCNFPLSTTELTPNTPSGMCERRRGRGVCVCVCLCVCVCVCVCVWHAHKHVCVWVFV